jgi:prepilin signal peptidase PulO-like enzyme (type II secretory pathway)
MKSQTKSFFKYIAPVIVFALPAIAGAQNLVTGGLTNNPGLQAAFGQSGLNSSQSLMDLITNVINILLFFAGAIAILFVIVGGYQYITSGGNEEQSEKGRKNVTNAIIGIVVIILAYAIINVIANLVSSNSGAGF